MSEGVADDMLRSGYDRWLRLEEAKGAISDDLKELFAEMKANGFDGKALRESFRRVRNAGDTAVEEHDALVDLYVSSLTGARPAYAHVEIIEEFDAQTGEITESRTDQPVPLSGEVALPASLAGVEGDADRQPILPETANDVPERATVGPADPLRSEAAARKDAGLPAPDAPLAFVLKPLRPYCQHPDDLSQCGGQGAKHCFSCRKSAWLEGKDAA